MKITMAHGQRRKGDFPADYRHFEKNFNNDILSRMEDSAVVAGSSRLAVTTDSFVVNPCFFREGISESCPSAAP